MEIQFNHKMPIIIKSIQTLYDLPNCGSGGCCHIVTDDNNIRDDDLKWVIDYCDKPENKDRVDKELSEFICKLLLQLSFEQRCILFYMFDSDFIYNYGNDLDESMWNYFITEWSDKSIQEIIEEFIY